MLLHVATGTAGLSRLGLSVPKRLAPRAVDRNRLKRVAREAFRRHEVRALGLDLVFTAREKFTPEGERAWSDDLGALLDRAAAL
jgi:ribonuclease P protein component